MSSWHKVCNCISLHVFRSSSATPIPCDMIDDRVRDDILSSWHKVCNCMSLHVCRSSSATLIPSGNRSIWFLKTFGLQYQSRFFFGNTPLQHIVAHCNTVWNTATHFAVHCNTLTFGRQFWSRNLFIYLFIIFLNQPTATHCITISLTHIQTNTHTHTVLEQRQNHRRRFDRRKPSACARFDDRSNSCVSVSVSVSVSLSVCVRVCVYVRERGKGR